MEEQKGSDSLIVRDSGSWAKEKLYYLERYLDIFSVGMKNKWTLYYLDLFAGPGKCRIRDTGEEIDGSPLIALKFNFAKYYFVEADEQCHHALTARVKDRAPEKVKDVEIVHGDCNEEVLKLKLPASGLGLAFIDPTGVSNLAFETIRAIVEGRKIDLIINFPEGMGIRMNLHQYTDSEKNALNRFMGSARWQQRQRQAPTSFDEMCKGIADEYLENLKGLGYLAVDSDWIPAKTDKNALLYYLLFASKDPRGIDFWHKITRIDPHGQRHLF